MRPAIAHYINGPRHGDTSRVQDRPEIIRVPIPTTLKTLPQEYREDAWGQVIPAPTSMSVQIGIYRLYGTVPPDGRKPKDVPPSDWELVYAYEGLE